jgi:hypothetical protein
VYQPPVAVVPFVLVPLSAMAMLLTALLAVPVAAVRRWWVVFNVAVVCLALYVARFTFEGVCRRLDATGAWWASPAAFWAAPSLVAAAGAAWVWRRPGGAAQPGKSDRVALSILALACLGLLAFGCWSGGTLLHPLWVPCGAVWAAALYALVRPPRAPAGLTPPGVLLVALAVACAAFAAALWLASYGGAATPLGLKLETVWTLPYVPAAARTAANSSASRA